MSNCTPSCETDLQSFERPSVVILSLVGVPFLGFEFILELAVECRWRRFELHRLARQGDIPSRETRHSHPMGIEDSEWAD
jgi:hypothetical protein